MYKIIFDFLNGPLYGAPLCPSKKYFDKIKNPTYCCFIFISKTHEVQSAWPMIPGSDNELILVSRLPRTFFLLSTLQS